MKLYYVYDTMCVFCYGFSPLMHRLYLEFNHKIEFELIPGGLWIDDHKKVVNHDVRSNLIKASNRLRQVTGVEFSDEFYDMLKNDVVLDSFPSLNAMTTVLDEQNPFKYLLALYDQTFVKGLINDNVNYNALARSVYNKDIKEMYKDEKTISRTYELIKKAQTLGATSYPTVIIEHDGKYESYDINYSDYNRLKNWVMEYL